MAFDTNRLIVKRTGRRTIFDAILAKDQATKRKFYTPVIDTHTLRKAWKTKTSAMKYAARVQLRYISLLEEKRKLLEILRGEDQNVSEEEDNSKKEAARED